MLIIFNFQQIFFNMSKIKIINFVWVTTGWISLVLGVIGIFLPLLPTTPFLILTAFCFSKGSKRLHAWIMNHKVTGPVIRDWNINRVIPKKVKLLACAMILSSITFMWIRIPLLYIKIIASIFSLGMLLFIVSQKSENKNQSVISPRIDF